MGEDVPQDGCEGGVCWGFGGPWRAHGWRARRYGSRADWEGSHGTFRWGGVGSSPHFPCVREESEWVCRHVTGAAEDRGKNLMDAFRADELVSTLIV